ncbi:Poly [ADP-ribose] polymerase 3, partial [Nowakowskiella sp. JEL0078]
MGPKQDPSAEEVAAMKVDHLKLLLSERSLSTAGKKQDLAKRLLDALEAASAIPSSSVDPKLHCNVDDIPNFTVKKLKELLEALGLPTLGKKADLVERLVLSKNQESLPKNEESELQNETTESTSKEEDETKDIGKKRKQKDNAESNVAKKKIKVDEGWFMGGEVFEDYGAKLNQTNIRDNNNKFYVIQLIKSNEIYYVLNRWGRVGEIGQSNTADFLDENEAVNAFKKKFKDKTSNDWDKRSNFVPKSGKYTLLEMDLSDNEEEEVTVAISKSIPVIPESECKLDPTVQTLIKFIFNTDMFVSVMKDMNIDVKKMPLGKLAKSQIKNGFTVLELLQQELDANRSGKLEELSSKFFTVIPHSFGRQRPPVISTLEMLQSKIDLLNTLGDIEIAQNLKNNITKLAVAEDKVTEDYKSLKNEILPVDPKSDEFKWIQQYMIASQSYARPKIVHAFRVNRESEKERMENFKHIGNRKLLWHGTNVGVVAAILNSGLRIMPHSGGRVGRGIYLASENSKSYGYVGWAK